MTTRFDRLPDDKKIAKLIYEVQRLRRENDLIKEKLEEAQGEVDRLDREELMGT